MSSDVIVYAYSTDNMNIANISNLINDHMPLKVNKDYNLIAKHGAILVAYTTS